jgi:FkbM family methyltransferase
MKSVRIGNRMITIGGASDSDPYFLGIVDGAEGPFAAFCELYLREDDVALDVGANIGITAALLSQRLHRGRIHAFEPAATVFSALERNIAANQLINVTAHNLALSDKSGHVNFNDSSAYGHISTDESGHRVRAATVDEVVAELGLQRLDFIKIDVEGFEEAVLKGAASTIKRFQPVIYLEFNSWCLTAYSTTNPVQFAKWLLDTFATVNVVVKGGAADGLLRHLERSDAIAFAHDNMVRNGCVDDLVVANDAARLHK